MPARHLRCTALLAAYAQGPIPWYLSTLLRPPYTTIAPKHGSSDDVPWRPAQLRSVRIICPICCVISKLLSQAEPLERLHSLRRAEDAAQSYGCTRSRGMIVPASGSLPNLHNTRCIVPQSAERTTKRNDAPTAHSTTVLAPVCLPIGGVPGHRFPSPAGNSAGLCLRANQLLPG